MEQQRLKSFFGKTNFSKTSLGTLFLFLFFTSFAQYPSPGAEWKTVTHRGKDIYNNPCPQDSSGDEWWYSHKNLYQSGAQIGYVAVGYVGDLAHPGDEARMREIFNEGPHSCQNHYPDTGPLFTSPNCFIYSTADCLESFDSFDATSTTNAKEMRTPFRGIVGRVDKTGHMVWCKVLTMQDLQEVIEYQDHIYVIGTTVAAMNMPKTQFLSYNPTSGASANTFDISASPAISYTQNGVPHMYVAKLDLDGQVIWQSIYGMVSYGSTSNDKASAWLSGSIGNDLIVNSKDGKIYAVGRSQTSVGSTFPVFVVKINPSTGYVEDKNVLPFPGVNSYGNSCGNAEGRSICEIDTSGNMAIGALADYLPTATDWHRGVVYSITPSLTLNPNWTSANPRHFIASGGTYSTTNLWELIFIPKRTKFW